MQKVERERGKAKKSLHEMVERARNARLEFSRGEETPEVEQLRLGEYGGKRRPKENQYPPSMVQ